MVSLSEARSADTLRRAEHLAPLRNWGAVTIAAGWKQALGARAHLEDQIAICPDLQTTGGLRLMLAIVASGIAGESGGGRATRLTVDTIVQACRKSGERDSQAIPHILRRAVEAANAAVLQEGRRAGHQKGARCTVTVAAVAGARAYLANVGDSRAFLVRGQRVTQLTVEHTWGNEMLRAGRRSIADLLAHPNSKKLTRAVGSDLSMRVDLGVYLSPNLSEATAETNQGLRLVPSDRLVLCSSGLFRPGPGSPGRGVKPDEIAAVVGSHQPQAAAENLVALAAGKRRAEGNVSVIVMQARNAAPRPLSETPGRRLLRSRRLLAFVCATLATLVLLGAGALIKRNAIPAIALSAAPTAGLVTQPGNALVSSVVGEVRYSSAQAEASRLLRQGDLVEAYPGRVLQVDGAGRLRLLTADGTVLILGDDTQIELGQIAQQSPGEFQVQVRLNYGRLLVSNQESASPGVAVLTSIGGAHANGALMGIEYAVGAPTGGAGQAGRLDVDCLAGRCVVARRGGAWRELAGGQHTWLDAGNSHLPVTQARSGRYAGLGDPGIAQTKTFEKGSQDER